MLRREDLVKVLVVVAFSAFILKYRGNEEVRTLLIFIFYFFASIIYKIDSRYPILAAIGSLILAAILLAQNKEALANKVAIYAYYFLVVGVLLNLVEYLRESRKEEEFKPTKKIKRVLAIVSGKGGVGKTTLATNLAVAFSKLGKKTIIIDLDLSMPNVDIAMGVDSRGLNEVLDGKDLKDAIKRKHKCDILPTLPIKDAYKSKEIKEKIKEIVEKAREEYEITVLDFPPGLEGLDILNNEIDVVIVANPEKMSLVDAYNVKKFLERKANVLGLVINRANSIDIDSIEEKLETPVLAVLPEERKVVECLEEEIPIAVKYQDIEFSKEIESLAEFLLKYWEEKE